MYLAESVQADDANSDRFHTDAALFHVSDEFPEAHFTIFIRVHSGETAVGITVPFAAFYLAASVLVDALKCSHPTLGAACRRRAAAIPKFLQRELPVAIAVHVVKRGDAVNGIFVTHHYTDEIRVDSAEPFAIPLFVIFRCCAAAD